MYEMAPNISEGYMKHMQFLFDPRIQRRVVCDPGYWNPVFNRHAYRNTQETLLRAEQMMLGINRNTLWRKNEYEARQLIWC